MKRIKKHSRTGTERGSELDRMIERLGVSGGYGGGKNLYKTKMSDRRAAKVKEAAKAVTKPKRQRSGKLMKGSRVQYPSPNKPTGGRTGIVAKNKQIKSLQKALRDENKAARAAMLKNVKKNKSASSPSTAKSVLAAAGAGAVGYEIGKRKSPVVKKKKSSVVKKKLRMDRVGKASQWIN